MRINLKQLRTLISDVEKDIKDLSKELNANKFKIEHTIPGVSERIVLTKIYPFESKQKELNKLIEKAIKLISIRNITNAKTYINQSSYSSQQKTLAEALVELDFKKELYKNIESYTALTSKKERKSDGYQSQSTYYEEKTPQFDLNEMLSQKTSLREEINKLEILIDKLNNETMVDVNI